MKRPLIQAGHIREGFKGDFLYNMLRMVSVFYSTAPNFGAVCAKASGESFEMYNVFAMDVMNRAIAFNRLFDCVYRSFRFFGISDAIVYY